MKGNIELHYKNCRSKHEGTKNQDIPNSAASTLTIVFTNATLYGSAVQITGVSIKPSHFLPSLVILSLSVPFLFLTRGPQCAVQPHWEQE